MHSSVLWFVINQLAGAEAAEAKGLDLYSICCIAGYCMVPLVVYSAASLLIPRWGRGEGAGRGILVLASASKGISGQALNGACCSGYVCSGKGTLGTDLKQELQVVYIISFSGCVCSGGGIWAQLLRMSHRRRCSRFIYWLRCGSYVPFLTIDLFIHPSICQCHSSAFPSQSPVQGPAIPGARGFLYNMEWPHGGQDHCAAHTRPGGHAGPHHVPLRAGVRSLCHAVCVLRFARASNR